MAKKEQDQQQSKPDLEDDAEYRVQLLRTVKLDHARFRPDTPNLIMRGALIKRLRDIPENEGAFGDTTKVG